MRESSPWASNAHDITVGNNIIAQVLVLSANLEELHSKGQVIGGSGNNRKRMAIIGKLIVYNVDRDLQPKEGQDKYRR